MSFLQELEVACSQGSAASRQRALWYATDLLIAGRYTEDEIWVFDEIIGRLEQEIEVAARTQLAKRLARADNAPLRVIKKLAFDDSIDVAGPVLQQSERLHNQALTATTRLQSPPPLLPLSMPKTTAQGVT